MGLRFIKIAVVYLVVGASLGLAMGMAQKFTLAPVHAHIVLLGWASLALAGIVYHLYPTASETRLARIHFWLHNLGLPCFMAGLALTLLGNEGVVPFLAGSATVVLVGLFVFAANVLINIRPASNAA
jgi:hypothetical protein